VPKPVGLHYVVQDSGDWERIVYRNARIRKHAAVLRTVMRAPAHRTRSLLAAMAVAGGSILAATVPATPALASTPALLAVTTSSLPAATAGTNDSTALHASGGIKPYIWSLADGSLPAGLVLHPTGQIDGKPSGPAGTYDFYRRGD
jgi:hypothetical protein